MKSMEQMQKEQLDKCFQNDGWPRPFVHFGGVVEVCRDREQWDRAFRWEIYGVIGALIAVALIAWFV